MQTPSNAPILSLVEQVQARRVELNKALTAKETSPSTRADLEAAVAALAPMLTGDLAKLPEMVSRDLSRWLDANKYLGAHAEAPAASPGSLPAVSPVSSPSMSVAVDDVPPVSSAAVTVPPIARA